MNIDKELNLLNKKIVYSFTKFSTSDYIGEIACIVWHVSCNLRCSYCYNDNIVFSKQGSFSHNDILEFLRKRTGLLTAVVLSGGEATMHDLKPFCVELKKLGFKIKLDTNGVNFKHIKELLTEDLIDFIALDFKATKDKYENITQKNSYHKFFETLTYLIKISFPFELRATINADLLDSKDINIMIETAYNVGYKGIFYIQNFLITPSNIGNITQKKVLEKEKIREDLLKIEFRN
ncbi:anaerobic ribonucleoside-triphosphate reductase activating protein [Aliarcobacter trophiarum]|uniref:anaerobic ribonucleoside-triphosphate reductase activating protein n=1 Tax=Aliarcobacter trophiarum TaxID=708186 RepID=UPI001E4F7F15|nr:anaerobic ribonucleoside-triphosphate reductase activating protein [Aliarcobacter trophiarum]